MGAGMIPEDRKACFCTRTRIRTLIHRHTCMCMYETVTNDVCVLVRDQSNASMQEALRPLEGLPSSAESGAVLYLKNLLTVRT